MLFAVITMSANQTMSEIHDRMPVILGPAVWPAWLGEESVDAAAVLRPAPDGLPQVRQDSGAVNTLRDIGPELMAPIAPAGNFEWSKT